jgi:hypothetical protein
MLVFSSFGAFGISNNYTIFNMNNEPVTETILGKTIVKPIIFQNIQSKFITNQCSSSFSEYEPGELIIKFKDSININNISISSEKTNLI